MGRKVLYNPFRNLANPVLPMKHRSRQPEQDDLLRPRLIDMINPRHELVKLTDLIDWKVFEREWSGFFPSSTGRGRGRPMGREPLLSASHG